MNNTIEGLRAQNDVLEKSPEYQRILPEVMREVYTTFVNNRIADYERFYANRIEDEDAYKDEDDPIMIEFFKNMQADLKARREEEKKKIEEAKQLLPTNPERAADLLIQLGSCHTLWDIQKRILKEKYNITWYTPAELHPDIRYDQLPFNKTDNMKKKKPSSLTERDYNIFQTMETLLQDTDETFSQSCMRFGDLPDEELLTPMQAALWAFCEDNPKLRKEEFVTWYEGLIEDEDLFRLDKPTLEILKKVRILFDEKTNDWMAKGLLNPNYDTSYTFWGIIGMAIYSIYHILMEKSSQLSDSVFFKNPMFGNYKIIALEYADNCTLNDFQNPRGYNRFDVEAILYYVMDEVFRGFDSYKEYQQTLELFQEVKNVVYEAPNRLLSDTKKELEERAKCIKEKKLPYAFFFAGAVIDYWLNKNK